MCHSLSVASCHSASPPIGQVSEEDNGPMDYDSAMKEVLMHTDGELWTEMGPDCLH